MAKSSLRFTRRPKARTVKKTSLDSLTAASQPVLDVAAEFKSSMGSAMHGDGWQELAWDMFFRVGELRYWAGWRSASCSRVELVPMEIDPATGKPTGVLNEDTAEGKRVHEIVSQIAGGQLGQSQMIKRAVEALSVPGETWLAILDEGKVDFDGNPEMTWLVVSADEVSTSGSGKSAVTEIELPSGEKHEFNDATDSMIHIWVPSPRKASEPDSPVRAALDALSEIVQTTKTIANASKSRLIGNGIVFLPAEMSLPATQGPTGTGDEEDDDDILAIAGPPAVKQLQELIWEVATTAYDDEDSMAALIPMFATVPAEFVGKVQHLKFDNQVTQIAIQTRNDAISRLAMSLDVAPERLLGLGSSTNHWTAWQISDEDVNLHISPVMELICQALTSSVLHKILISEGINPKKYIVGYDASKLTVDPDKTNAANGAFTSGAITAEAYIEYLGLDAGSGYDFDTDEGWQKWARDLCGRDPQFAPIFRSMLGPGGKGLPLDLQTMAPAVARPPSYNEITQPQQQKGLPEKNRGKPDTEEKSSDPNRTRVSQQASVIPMPLAVTMIERLLLNRAFELAGKRRRKASDHERLRHVPMYDTHRYMPPVDREEVPRLVSGWDTALADEAIQLMPFNTEDLRARVYATIEQELTARVIDSDVEEA